MSLYAQYIKEREGFETLEGSFGFATYKCVKEECYLRDVYVVPDKRNKGVSRMLVDRVSEIAKGLNCKYLITSAAPSLPSSLDSLKAIIAQGFKPFKNDKDLTYFFKELI